MKLHESSWQKTCTLYLQFEQRLTQQIPQNLPPPSSRSGGSERSLQIPQISKESPIQCFLCLILVQRYFHVLFTFQSCALRNCQDLKRGRGRKISSSGKRSGSHLIFLSRASSTPMNDREGDKKCQNGFVSMISSGTA